MKLLRVGDKGKEIPAIVDGENNYRDLSSLADDLKPSTLNFEIFKKIKDSDISKLPIISKDQRIGSCVNKPGKFIAIGLNYSDHAKETGAKTPTEPIVFMKATSSICGPNDEIEIPKGSNKLDITLISHPVDLVSTLVIEDIEVIVKYNYYSSKL